MASSSLYLSRTSINAPRLSITPCRVPIKSVKRDLTSNVTSSRGQSSTDDMELTPRVKSSTQPVTPESAQELLQELLDPEKFGTRGEGWFLAQVALIALVLLPPNGLRQIVDTLGGCLLLAGVALIAVGGLNLGQNLTPVPKPRENDHSLVTDGVYQLCRHPMYGGIIVGAAGLALFTGDEARLALTALMFWVLDQKATVEEEYLEEKYPGEYAAYKRSGVKKLIPWLF